MGKPQPIDLRERVVGFVEEGTCHGAAAVHFRISPRFVNTPILRKMTNSTLAPMWHGHSSTNSKFRPHEDRLRQRITENGGLPLDELRCEQLARDIEVHRSTIGRFLKSLRRSNKKTPLASKHRRTDIALQRELCLGRRKSFFAKALSRLVFLRSQHLRCKRLTSNG